MLFMALASQEGIERRPTRATQLQEGRRENLALKSGLIRLLNKPGIMIPHSTRHSSSMKGGRIETSFPALDSWEEVA